MALPVSIELSEICAAGNWESQSDHLQVKYPESKNPQCESGTAGSRNTATSPLRHFLPELDVLRLLAALVVCFHHTWIAFTPDDKLQLWYRRPLWHDLGSFSVCIFFGVSGQALSLNYLHCGKADLLCGSIFRRVPRLCLPALAASVLCLVLSNLGCFSLYPRAQFLAGSVWGRIDDSSHMPRNMQEAVLGSLSVIWRYEDHPFPGHLLWTLPHELCGSAYVYATIPFMHHMAKDSNSRTARFMLTHILAASCLFILSVCESCSPILPNSWYYASYNKPGRKPWDSLFCFEIGIALSHFLVLHGRIPIVCSISVFLICFGIVMGVVLPMVLTSPAEFTLLGAWLNNFGAATCLFGVFLLPEPFTASLEKLLPLGRLAFGIYLTSGMVIYSLGAAFYASCRPAMPQGVVLFLVVLICLLGTLVAGKVFWHLVDEPVGVRLPKYIWTVTHRAWNLQQQHGT